MTLSDDIETLASDDATLGLVLVTGASGFVGSAVADVFRRAGHPVRAFVRAASPRTHLRGIDVAEGDIRDRATVAAALRGVRYLVHAAADYRLWAPSPRDIIVTNVEGTRIVMEEALRAGVERIVYTSSVATLAVRPDGAPADEKRPLSVKEAVGAYKQSKVLAERLVEELVARSGLPAVIVNPSTPIGPRDVKPTPTGRIIVEAAAGRMPAFVDTGLNLVHVDDVAAGHLAALRRGRIGERYILGGENVLLSAMLADIAGLTRAPPASTAAAAAADLSARRRGRGAGPPHRPNALRHPRRPAHGQAQDVLHRCQGAARARLYVASVSGGPRRRARLVPRRRIPPVSAAALAVAVATLATWLYLILGRGGFWRGRECDRALVRSGDGDIAAWPRVVAIIPARDEAAYVGTAIRSLLRQDYPGPFAIILVDDQSADGTAEVARRAAVETGGADRLTIISGCDLPPGWTGKLWAMRQGVTETENGPEPSDFLWFTDADIAYAPDVLRRLVAGAVARGTVLTSLMVKLRCESVAERLLDPGLRLLLRRSSTRSPGSTIRGRRTAAAAGGCMLVRRDGARRCRRARGDPRRAHRRLRARRADEAAGADLARADGACRKPPPYPAFDDIRRMVARSAYAELRYSPAAARRRRRRHGAHLSRAAAPHDLRDGLRRRRSGRGLGR